MQQFVPALVGPTIFPPICIRTGSVMFYPRHTPSMIVDNISSLTVVQCATAHRPCITGSYADRRKTPLSGSGRSCTSALGRKRSFDVCVRVVRHSALRRGTTIGTKREGNGGLGGRRFLGKLGSYVQRRLTCNDRTVIAPESHVVILAMNSCLWERYMKLNTAGSFALR